MEKSFSISVCQTSLLEVPLGHSGTAEIEKLPLQWFRAWLPVCVKSSGQAHNQLSFSTPNCIYDIKAEEQLGSALLLRDYTRGERSEWFSLSSGGKKNPTLWFTAWTEHIRNNGENFLSGQVEGNEMFMCFDQEHSTPKRMTCCYILNHCTNKENSTKWNLLTEDWLSPTEV